MKQIPVRQGIFGISDGSAKPYLIGSKCAGCGKHVFPPKKICPFCFDERMEAVSLSVEGQIYSYTIVRQAPAGFQAPYATVYVDLPEGVRVFAQSDLSSWENGIPRIGAPVELVLGPLCQDREGNQVIGMKFNPI